MNLWIQDEQWFSTATVSVLTPLVWRALAVIFRLCGCFIHLLHALASHVLYTLVSHFKHGLHSFELAAKVQIVLEVRLQHALLALDIDSASLPVPLRCSEADLCAALQGL